MVGLTRFELVTPRLSSVCSNQLSYRPLESGLARSPPRGAQSQARPAGRFPVLYRRT